MISFFKKFFSQGVSYSEQLPETSLEEQILKFLHNGKNEDKYYFKGSKDAEWFYKPRFLSLNNLEIAIRDGKVVIGKFIPRIGPNLMNFEIYGRENKKEAIALCKSLNKKFKCVINCILVCEEKRVI